MKALLTLLALTMMTLAAQADRDVVLTPGSSVAVKSLNSNAIVRCQSEGYYDNYDNYKHSKCQCEKNQYGYYSIVYRINGTVHTADNQVFSNYEECAANLRTGRVTCN